MPNTSHMSPEEYAAYTESMSYPAGASNREQDGRERADNEAAAEANKQACQAADADHVDCFMRHLEDPDIRLTTEKPHDWTNWGVKGKAAILAALREYTASVRARAAVVDASQPIEGHLGRTI